MTFFKNLSRRVRQINLLIQPPPSLRRRSKRHDIDIGIVASVGGQQFKQRAIDISLGGMMLIPGFNAHLREPVKISVSGLLTDAPARVVGLRPDGIAVQFDSDAHGRLLTAWMMERSGRKKSA